MQINTSQQSSAVQGPLPSFGGISRQAEQPSEDTPAALRLEDNGPDPGYPDDKPWFDKVYPFKAEEFGQLALPENVIMAKLVSLNNYGA